MVSEYGMNGPIKMATWDLCMENSGDPGQDLMVRRWIRFRAL